MKYKIISTDLDGTLLDGSESISVQNSAAMKALRDLGMVIAVNTGRTLFEIPDSVRANPYIDYYICSNGAAIYDGSKKLIYSKYLSAKDEQTVYRMLGEYATSIAAHDDGVSVLSEKNSSVEYWMDHRASEYSARNFVRFSEVAKDFEKRYDEGREIEMFCCYFKFADQMHECEKRLAKIPTIKTASSSGKNIEVFNADVDKGETLLALCDMLGIGKDEIIGAGDSQNDISMLEVCSLSLAVENSKEEVKAISDAIICSNEEHIMVDILNMLEK